MNTGYRKIARPLPSEYPAYSQPYFDLVKTDTDILQELHDNFYRLKELISPLSEEQLCFRYETNKWTIREILVHNIDDERIYSYRALRYARNDSTVLPGFEEKDYARYSHANDRSLESIFEEYESVRQATLTLFQFLPEEAMLRSGSISDEHGKPGNNRTVRAMAYHIAGHEWHHLKIIREKYLRLPG